MIFSLDLLSWPFMLFGAVAAGLRIAPETSTALKLSYQSTDRRACMLVVARLSVAVEMSAGILKVPEPYLGHG
ncbi:hypothetical protein H1R20_g13064, partial [Candolleomyces eurysporus]